ncbi:hypothetical protein LHJ74_20365 [Streptomyces sp. N2-109]|uniref:Uncharacterized protein n=1 Tax=Streptomyces gossypii TaxID=2883101 RepID=A0ABT2JWE4_9ACTN|nr:hypothetical protein [Streptomyces gossypii]MCT2592227.1 hypothetical protein [Streptomyces gossypii]
MSDLQFYVHFIQESKVLGVDLRSAPEVWESNLGGEYVDDFRKNYGRRDYGLIEISFQKAQRTWECFGVSLQVHRLAMTDVDIIPEPLSRKFGEFRSHLPYEALLSGGLMLDRVVDSPDDALQVFEARDSIRRVQVLVANVATGGISAGDVWAITSGSLSR